MELLSTGVLKLAKLEQSGWGHIYFKPRDLIRYLSPKLHYPKWFDFSDGCTINVSICDDSCANDFKALVSAKRLENLLRCMLCAWISVLKVSVGSNLSKLII